jgi:hypothetical protein
MQTFIEKRCNDRGAQCTAVKNPKGQAVSTTLHCHLTDSDCLFFGRRGGYKRSTDLVSVMVKRFSGKGNSGSVSQFLVRRVPSLRALLVI